MKNNLVDFFMNTTLAGVFFNGVLPHQEILPQISNPSPNLFSVVVLPLATAVLIPFVKGISERILKWIDRKLKIDSKKDSQK